VGVGFGACKDEGCRSTQMTPSDGAAAPPATWPGQAKEGVAVDAQQCTEFC